MGYGDWILATGQVRELHATSRMPVMVVDRRGRSQWSEVFEHNPKIIRDIRIVHQTLLNASGVRPYIAEQTQTRWRWRKFSPPAGELYLTRDEAAFGAQHGGKVLIEPNIKGTSGNNKAWIWDRWQRLVYENSDRYEFVQVGVSTVPRLEGVTFVNTPSFRHACAVLAASRAYVGTEGGLHHAAAAVNVPAVVLFGGFISPDVTGYKTHRNLFTGGTACGWRVPCAHCREAMNKITVDMVAGNMKEIIE